MTSGDRVQEVIMEESGRRKGWVAPNLRRTSTRLDRRRWDSAHQGGEDDWPSNRKPDAEENTVKAVVEVELGCGSGVLDVDGNVPSSQRQLVGLCTPVDNVVGIKRTDDVCLSKGGPLDLRLDWLDVSCADVLTLRMVNIPEMLHPRGGNRKCANAGCSDERVLDLLGCGAPGAGNPGPEDGTHHHTVTRGAEGGKWLSRLGLPEKVTVGLHVLAPEGPLRSSFGGEFPVVGVRLELGTVCLAPIAEVAESALGALGLVVGLLRLGVNALVVALSSISGH